MSKRTGVNIETIRYSERIGLLPAPLRSAGRHRLFDDRHLRDHDLTCDEIKAPTEQHIAEIRHKLRDLTKLERVLSELAAQCHGDKGPDCPILDALGAKA